MRSLIAASTLLLMTACATSDGDREPVNVDTPPATQTVPDAFDLAMQTVDGLVAGGNEQAAIDRLTQLLGRPDLSDEDLAATLLKRAELRYGAGHDVEGALLDLEELFLTYPDSPSAAAGTPLHANAAEEISRLRAALAGGELSPTEEFNVRFRLGQHQDAADLMLARSLLPENEYVVDMFQMGYLCDDETLTGPGYAMVEPDGTERTVRFCEFGK
ncbi:MAG: hypothetical protein GYB42_12030 [Alphaproteobacteria bacterium]|nr:hypothetical protein [Alphaproteobacteria bacterium]